MRLRPFLLTVVLVVAPCGRCDFDSQRPADAAGDAPDRGELLHMAWHLVASGKAIPATFDPAPVVEDILAAKPTLLESRAMLAWAYFESGWGTYTLGDCTCWVGSKRTSCPSYADRTVGRCSSFGVMQTKQPAKWVTGATPAKVAVDRRLGFRVGLEVLRSWEKAAGGDMRKALRGYSSGHMDRAYEKVATRCAWVSC